MLEKCSECGEKISSNARVCPRCGNTEAGYLSPRAVRKQEKEREDEILGCLLLVLLPFTIPIVILIVILVGVVRGLGIILGLVPKKNGTKSPPDTGEAGARRKKYPDTGEAL